ncbi:MAG: hypothetical protein JNM00_06665, partial [Flavobacteriales bacterium]|nr:hypothetical protein [Flavobacteriales bacterium]
MKQILTLTFLLTILFGANAQGPEAFNYQAVIRDGDGNLVANQLISLRFSIGYSPIGGEPLTIFYIETHDALTNEFGLVNVAIGLGQPELNAFSDLQWG